MLSGTSTTRLNNILTKQDVRNTAWDLTLSTLVLKNMVTGRPHKMSKISN